LTGVSLSLYYYASLSVVSTDVVYVCGDYPGRKEDDPRVPVVLKTMDGGKNWTETIIRSPDIQIVRLSSIHFVNAETGWATGNDSQENGVLIRTTDGGATWRATRLQQKQLPTTVFFVDANNGWMGGTTAFGEDAEEPLPSAIMATTDGGTTWHAQNNVPVAIYDLFFLDGRNGWASGALGYLYHTNDAGLSWNQQHSEIETNVNMMIPGSEGARKFKVQRVQFINPEVGFAAASSDDDDTGRFMATSNGGKSWRRQWILADSGLLDVYFANENEGWGIAIRGNFVYHTTDGGKNWVSEPHVFEQEGAMVRIKGADAAHVWGVGGGAVFVRSPQ
jgi:photosystem II stability/assembly factor-like uncharacterized protein